MTDDLGIELEELRDPGREPDRTEADRGGDPELAGRLVLRIGQPGAGGRKLGEDVMGGAVEELALLGQDQAAGVAVEQRHLEVLLERADLAADRRLRQAQIMAGMGEAAGLGDRVEDPELVPIHRPSAPSLARVFTRRLRSSCHGVASHLSASSAAMQPRPAAVTAWRKTSSVTSPAANTPGTGVAVEFGAVIDVAPGFIGSWPTNNSVAGAWPIATKTPSVGNSIDFAGLYIAEPSPGDHLRIA